MAPALKQTLAGLSSILQHCRDDWWIISSVAVALHTGKAVETADVDIVVSIDDAGMLADKLSLDSTEKSENPLFRSDIFLRYDALPLATEFMAGFKVRAGNVWQPVCPQTRRSVQIDGQSFFVPEARELIDMLRLFGREKDMVRIDLLLSSPLVENRAAP